MTKIVAEELKTELSQDITLLMNKPYEVTTIKPYFFIYNASAITGTFTFSIYNSSNTIELASKTFTISDVKTQGGVTNEYFRTWYPVTFDSPAILPKGQYNFKLSSSGYTFSSNAFIAWCREHENEKVNFNYIPENDLENPLSYELYTRKGFNVTRIVDIEDSYESATPPSLSGIGWIIKSVQTVSAGEFFDIDDENNFQYQPVVSDGGQVAASTTPFGTSIVWPDGVTVRLVGTSDTDYVTVNFSDIQYGVILNGAMDLTLDAVLELQYDSVQERWLEISRNT